MHVCCYRLLLILWSSATMMSSVWWRHTKTTGGSNGEDFIGGREMFHCWPGASYRPVDGDGTKVGQSNAEGATMTCLLAKVDYR